MRNSNVSCLGTGRGVATELSATRSFLDWRVEYLLEHMYSDVERVVLSSSPDDIQPVHG